MKISKKNIIDFLIYMIIIVLMSIFYLANAIGSRNDLSLLVVFTFIIIGIIGFLMYVLDKRYLSINKLIGVFVILFCSMAPYYQYCSRYNIWGLTSFDNNDYIQANLLIILFLVVFLISYYFINQKLKKKIIKEKKFETQKINDKKTLTSFILFVFIFLSLVSLVYLFVSGNLIDFDGNTVEKSSLEIFSLKIFYYFPISCFLYFIYENRKGNVKLSKFEKNLFIFIILLIIVIIFFPFNGSVSRYLLLGTYIALFYALSYKFKHSSFVLLAFAIGFYLIFPAMNFFKYHSILDIAEFKLGGFDFNSADYDAYQIFMMTIKYVKTNGILYGKNFLSAIFCLIPRTLWESKLEQTGSIIANYYGGSFTNLSCPFFAESYAAFGSIGIVFITPILAYLIIKIETKAITGSTIAKCLETSLLGLIIYYMRGALLPTTSFLIGVFLSSIIVYFIVRILQSYKNLK